MNHNGGEIMKRGEFLRGAWLAPMALLMGARETGEVGGPPEIRSITIHGDGVQIIGNTIHAADGRAISVLGKLHLPAGDPATWRYRR